MKPDQPCIIDTPMAIDTRVRATGKTRQAIASEGDGRVALRHRMGMACNMAAAALVLSDEVNFIAGVSLLVDERSALKVDQFESGKADDRI